MTVRRRSIYAKLLVGFGAVLLLTVCLAALWSWWLFRGPSGSEYLFEAETQARLVRLALAEAAAAEPNLSPADNPRLVRAIREVAAAGRARLWLEGGDGAVLLQSFDGPPPRYVVRPEPASPVVTLLEPRDGAQDMDLFFRTPVDLATWGRATLYVAFEEYRPPGRAEAWFVPGLAAIAVLVALFIIPVSRFITSPLRRLQEAVTGYADGDLRRRCGGSRQDEIGDLGRAFDAMADNLERMIRGSRELVANVSHELRSPMARMRVSAELLGDALAGDVRAGDARNAARRHLDGIREEVEYLDRLVGRILEFSRLDLAGDGPLEVPVDLPALLEGILERYAPAMERGGVTLRRDPRPGRGPRADRVRGPDAAGVGPVQPRGQCGQVLSPRGPDRGARPARGRLGAGAGLQHPCPP